MNISSSIITLPKSQQPRRPLPQHDPGLLRESLEMTSGIIGAVMKAPINLVSGTVLGGYHGRRRGIDANVETPPRELALQMYVANALGSTAVGAATAFAATGPAGAAASVAKDVAIKGAKYAIYRKWGKPGKLSRRMAAKIDEKVEGGEGALKGTGKGALAGGTSAARGGAVIGFRQGRGTASGVIEGLSEFDDEIKAAQKPDGGFIAKTVAVAGGAVNSLLSVPAGVVQGLTRTTDGGTRRSRQLLATTLTGAVTGGAAGLLGGPLGAAIGAGVGAVTGLVSSVTNKDLSEQVDQSLNRAAENDTNMGSDDSNERRDTVQNAIVGALSGARSGWDRVQTAVGD